MLYLLLYILATHIFYILLQIHVLYCNIARLVFNKFDRYRIENY